jgi:hypothetical protein
VNRELSPELRELHNALEFVLGELARAHRLVVEGPFSALSASEIAVNTAAHRLLWCVQVPVSSDPATHDLFSRVRTELHALAILCGTAAQLAGGWVDRLNTMLNGYGQRDHGYPPQRI